MSSLRRINASRANGALSHGPVTPEGKARSAMNATHHGLLARAAVLDTENHETFQALVDAFIRYFQPDGEVEHALVEEMAVNTWRTRRCWAMETRAVSDLAGNSAAPAGVAGLGAAYCELAAGPGLPLILRYEGRINQNYHRALRNLLALREKREIPNEPNPVSEHADEPPPEPEPPAPAPAKPHPPAPSELELIPPIPIGPPVPLPDPTEDPFVKRLAEMVYAGKVKLL